MYTKQRLIFSMFEIAKGCIPNKDNYEWKFEINYNILNCTESITN